MFNNKYSFLSIARNALNHHENWQKTWNSPEPKKSYDAIIVGGGGHGLTTAYYLAKNHGINNIAVIEKGWIGGGNTCLLYTSPSPRDTRESRMPSSA